MGYKNLGQLSIWLFDICQPYKTAVWTTTIQNYIFVDYLSETKVESYYMNLNVPRLLLQQKLRYKRNGTIYSLSYIS